MTNERLPSLRSLHAFEVVSRLLQVNLAASELCVTSSAISHLLRRLEHDLGVVLVKKSGRNIVLTKAGNELAPKIQSIFRSLDQAVADTREISSPDSLTVCLRPYFATKWLSPRLSRFWVKHPGIELKLIHTNKQLDLNNNRVDLAIEWLATNSVSENSSLLIPGELTPVLSPKLENACHVKSPVDLFNYTLLRETDHDSWKDWFDLAGAAYQAKKRMLLIDDSNVRYQAAIDGQGVELACRSLITDDLASGKLIAPLDLSLNTFSYYLVEPDTTIPKKATKLFKEWIISESVC